MIKNHDTFDPSNPQNNSLFDTIMANKKQDNKKKKQDISKTKKKSIIPQQNSTEKNKKSNVVYIKKDDNLEITTKTRAKTKEEIELEEQQLSAFLDKYNYVTESDSEEEDEYND